MPLQTAEQMHKHCHGAGRLCLTLGCLLSGLVAGLSLRTCPPPDAPCVARVRHELTVAWKLRAEVDKVISQRSYELLILYDWIPAEDTRASFSCWCVGSDHF